MDLETLLSEATNLRNNGNEAEAIGKYLELIKEFNNLGQEDKVAYCHQMIGVCHTIANETELASEAIGKAIVIFEKLEDHFGLGNSYRDLGLAYFSEGDNDKALENLEKSQRELAMTDKKGALGMTVVKLAVVVAKRDLAQGEGEMKKGLEIIRSSGDDWFFEMTTLVDLGRIELELKKYDEALDHLNTALDMIFNHKSEGEQRRRLAQIYGLLTRIYKELGKDEKSAEFESCYRNEMVFLDEKTREKVERELS